MLWKTNIDSTTNVSAAKSASVVWPIINVGNDLGSVQRKRMKAVVVSRKSSRLRASLFTATSPDCSGTKSYKGDHTRTQSCTAFLSSATVLPHFFAFFTHSHTHICSFHVFYVPSTFSFCLPDLLSCQPSGLSPRDQLVQTGSVASAGFGPISAVFIVLTSEN